MSLRRQRTVWLPVGVQTLPEIQFRPSTRLGPRLALFHRLCSPSLHPRLPEPVERLEMAESRSHRRLLMVAGFDLTRIPGTRRCGEPTGTRSTTTHQHGTL